MAEEQVIGRTALGRLALCGDLYNARTDNFHRMSVFIDESDIQTYSKDVFKEKVLLMNGDPLSFVEKQLRLSLATGACEYEVQWRPLQPEMKASKTITKYLMYQIQTKHESCDISHEHCATLFNIEAIERELPTHIVSDIFWGGIAVLACTYQIPDNADKGTFEEIVNTQMNLIQSEIQDEERVDFSQVSNNLLPRQMHIFGDFPEEEINFPQTLQEGLQIVKGLRSKIHSSQGGKGVPILYELQPISSLLQHANLHIKGDITFRSIKKSQLGRIISAWEERCQLMQRFFECRNKVVEHDYCVKERKIAEISHVKDQIEKEEPPFENKLLQMLIEVRSGKIEPKELEHFIKYPQVAATPQYISDILKRLKSTRMKVQFVEMAQQHRAKYVGHEKIQGGRNTGISYALHFTQKAMAKDPVTWERNRQLFFQLMEDEKNAKFYVVDGDFPPNNAKQHHTSCIKVFEGGNIVLEDLLNERESSGLTVQLNSADASNTEHGQPDSTKAPVNQHRYNPTQNEEEIPSDPMSATETDENIDLSPSVGAREEYVVDVTTPTVTSSASKTIPKTKGKALPSVPVKHDDTEALLASGHEEDTENFVDTPVAPNSSNASNKRPARPPPPPTPTSNELELDGTISSLSNEGGLGGQNQLLQPPTPNSSREVVNQTAPDLKNDPKSNNIPEIEQPTSMPISSEKELNILILGETGVGKSTWINGFINYTKFDSLDNAENGELASLIPSKFTVYNENFEQIIVSNGSDKNEVQLPGQSATQEARVYPVQVNDTLVRLIDTPGIGDTRGIEQDKVNFQNILTTLSYLEEIHGICIFLKPNNARINLMFRFCIKELLKYLHRDASKNIIFCFTNSRGTLFRPGDTFPALVTLLNENKEIEIPVNRQTVYCFDSEAYRFLAAIKNNPPISFTEEERENFSLSWEKSVGETNRILAYIKELAPHPIQSTLNLNYVRELVLKMVRPLAEIIRNVQTNQSILEQERQEILNTRENIKELEKRRMTKRTEIKVSPLSHPRMVCSNIDCVRIWSIGGVKTTHYEKVCHERCQLFLVKQDSIGSPFLRLCSKLRTGKCKQKDCGHTYKDHIRIYYESKQEVTQEENRAVVESIANNMSAAEMKQNMINEKNKLINQFQSELKEIEKASVTFAYFLKINAITTFSDEMELYFHQLIREEKYKVEAGGSGTTLRLLEHSLQSYKSEKASLEQQVQKRDIPVPTTENVNELVRRLQKLKFSGKSLTEALKCVNHAGKLEYRASIERKPTRTMGRERQTKGYEGADF